MLKLLASLAFVFAVSFVPMASSAQEQTPLERRAAAWPKTDLSKRSVDLAEILWGGVAKDGIPAIDKPAFLPPADISGLEDTMPVISLSIGDEARAYPLGTLTRHEIVNDVIGGEPVTVTYCPLCNSAIAFSRKVDGKVLDFGVSGFLRNSDMVMYDRQTETLWQQFSGEAIIGEMTGTMLKMIPVRVESFARFKERYPHGLVLAHEGGDLSRYRYNPYVGYEWRGTPYFKIVGGLPGDIPAMERVIAFEGDDGKPVAVRLTLLRTKGKQTIGNVVVDWIAGQNSALDTPDIAEGVDIGNGIVQRNGEDILHDITFAFVFRAFHGDAPIIQE